MERRDGASVRVGAYSQAAEPRRSRHAAIGAAQQNTPGSIKRSLTQAFRFSPIHADWVTACGYSRPRKCLAAIKPIASSAPTSPTTPFQP
ncbi:hypothetical protein HDG42_003026 [Paraburkholderia sp. JPY171]|nr:hypothetical protein [Paraburkholderia atlantica]